MTKPLSGEIRFADLCAGLGGFHQALKYATQINDPPLNVAFKCVLAAELDPDLRALYPRNFCDLTDTYLQEHPYAQWLQHRERLTRELGPLANELDLYDADGGLKRVHGDIRALVDDSTDSIRCWSAGRPMVPVHDLLCAGFPCQPFSKSGAQRGFKDVNGTVFHLISIILKQIRPGFVLLENVGNFERHDKGNTWYRVKEILSDLGYEFRATTHVGGPDGGTGLLSPHHIGLPHHRERFFIAARHKNEDRLPPFSAMLSPFPIPQRKTRSKASEADLLDQKASTALSKILSASAASATTIDFSQSRVSLDRLQCVVHWQDLLDKIAEHDAQIIGNSDKRIQPMPSFPIWGFELDLWNYYPITSNPRNHLRVPKNFIAWRKKNPLGMIKARKLQAYAPTGDRNYLRKGTLSRNEVARFRDTMPGYAIDREEWPRWKQLFLEQNREWAGRLWSGLDPTWLRAWLDKLYSMPPSHQKLEWNCKDETLNLWDKILQFRPSGLRAKRFAHVPALVAMTTTQLPIVPSLGPEPDGATELAAKVRHLLPTEALQLQGLPPTWLCPPTREATFQALGNAVNADLVGDIFYRWFNASSNALAQQQRQFSLITGNRPQNPSAIALRA